MPAEGRPVMIRQNPAEAEVVVEHSIRPRLVIIQMSMGVQPLGQFGFHPVTSHHHQECYGSNLDSVRSRHAHRPCRRLRRGDQLDMAGVR